MLHSLIVESENWGFVIKRLREQRGLTQKDLAIKSRMDRSYLSRIEIGQIKESGRGTFSNLAEGLGMTLDELNAEITGKRLESHPQTPQQAYVQLGNLLPVYIPLYTEFTLHYGEGRELIDYIPYAPSKAASKNIEAFLGHGSCLEPKVLDGDRLIIDRDAVVEHGDYAACLIDDTVHVGQVKKIGDALFLQNNHGQIPLRDCKAFAKVIELIRKL